MNFNGDDLVMSVAEGTVCFWGSRVGLGLSAGRGTRHCLPWQGSEVSCPREGRELTPSVGKSPDVLLVTCMLFAAKMFVS